MQKAQCIFAFNSVLLLSNSAVSYSIDCITAIRFDNLTKSPSGKPSLKSLQVKAKHMIGLSSTGRLQPLAVRWLHLFSEVKDESAMCEDFKRYFICFFKEL